MNRRYTKNASKLSAISALALYCCFAPMNTANAASPAQIGQWGPAIQFATVPVAAAMLPNGKILIWSSWDKDGFTYGSGQATNNLAQQQTQTQLYDPATRGVSRLIAVTNTGHDMFCPGTAFLEDGRLLVSGGGGGGIGPFVANTSIYDFSSDQWYGDAQMHHERWYNTSVTLANGDVFTLGGRNTALNTNDPGELWSDGQGWTELSGTPVKPMTYDAGKRSHEHPKLFLAPNGRLFAAGPSRWMRYYDTIGLGHVDSAATARGDDAYAQSNVSVLFDEGKILAAGGSSGYDVDINTPATRNAYVIDINGAVVPKKIAPMARPRAFANGVILPDGSVLVVGGLDKGRNFWDAGAQTVPELFDPVSETWTDMADQVTPRTYHSVALLMPDGRVFAGGGGLCRPTLECSDSLNHRDAQLFSPPYLFRGPRPSISDAPGAVGYGVDFRVSASADTVRFTMVRLSATTHGVNTDQRIVKPQSVSDGQGGFLLTAPANPNLAPPGYYMLFTLSANGVPSLAKMVQIARGAVSIDSPGNQSNQAGSTVSLPIGASAPPNKLLKYSAIGLPAGLSMNTGSGVIDGVPATEETKAVVVTVTDGVSRASTGFTWYVTPRSATPAPSPASSPVPTPAPSSNPEASPNPGGTPKPGAIPKPGATPKPSPARTSGPALSSGPDLAIRLRGPKKIKVSDAGTFARYLVAVANKSKTAAQDTFVTFNYASGLEVVSKPKICTEAGSGQLLCALGDLRQHRTKHFKVKVKIASGMVSAEARASVACNSQNDPNVANNISARQTLIK